MQIFLIRHGMTEANKQLRYAGSTDVPLCAEGIAEAEALGGITGVKKVYVTPLIRTQQTARILFPAAEQTVVHALREMDFGDFENRSAEEMKDDGQYRAWVDGSCLAPCPNGESMDAFSSRVCAGFVQCLEARQDKETPAIFVVHGGTIMSILREYARPRVGFYDVHAKNCQGFRCALSPAADGLPLTLTELTPFARIQLQTSPEEETDENPV